MKLTVKAGILAGLAASMLSAAAYAADKPKVLVIYPYLGDQSFVC
jgi:ABC-type sugar transport system substrate-binding protein